MRVFLLLAVIFLLAFSVKATDTPEVFSHTTWDQLLQKHVTAAGNVNYEGFKQDKAKLQQYLNKLQAADINGLSKAEREAFWINVYNAYTVKVILDNMPLKSITDIKQGDKDAWHIKVVKAAGQTLTLNEVEHQQLLKQFGDPRIHFGINCASFSCPRLHNRAFTGANLNTNLERLAKGFVNDPKRNKIAAGSVQLSEIFNWYKGDFTKNGSVIDFLNKYAAVKIGSSASVAYLPYDWSLNK